MGLTALTNQNVHMASVITSSKKTQRINTVRTLFTKEEDRIILDALATYGEDWNAVRRTAMSIKCRWATVLSKNPELHPYIEGQPISALSNSSKQAKSPQLIQIPISFEPMIIPVYQQPSPIIYSQQTFAQQKVKLPPISSLIKDESSDSFSPAK